MTLLDLHFAEQGMCIRKTTHALTSGIRAFDFDTAIFELFWTSPFHFRNFGFIS
jgi:hypothetical protein